MEEPPRHGEAGGSHSEIGDAQIRGDVVQARDVSGGVHFHAAHDDPPEPRVVPRQLPASVRVFVNRQSEIRALTRLTGAARSATSARAQAATVVVITGSAGVGKTALALHWAHRIRDRFPDGELYVNLRGFDEGPPVSAEAVLDRFLRDLGVSPQDIPADLDGRASLFRSLVVGRRILIVLDNAADIGQVRPLLPGGSGPFVITTSRKQLSGLAVRDGAQRIRLDIFQESDAVALLRRVTRTGGRRDAPDDLTELAQVCARLPLALRVAAEHAISRPAMELAELIADLRDDSMLWEALSTDEGQHGDGVRTVFAWSYRDLPPDAARMFRLLGLHSGPDIGLPVAAAVGGVPVRTARRALDILTGAFLLETPRSGRYQLHDLLRAYALDQARAIDTDAERREALDRIIRWYTSMTLIVCEILYPRGFFPIQAPDSAGLDLIPLDSPAAARGWFDIERPNMAANARSALDSGLPRRAWELAMAMSLMHADQFMFDDWSVLSELAITAAGETGDPAALAAALDGRGEFLFRRGLLEEALATHTRALSIRREIGDQQTIIRSLNALGLIGVRTRELAQAEGYFADAVQRAHRIGDSLWENAVRMNLAETHLEAGHAAEALQIMVPLAQLFVDQRGEGQAWWLISQARRTLGDNTGALTAIDTTLRIAENLNNRVGEARWLIEAARVHLALGDTDEAMRCCRMAVSLQRQVGDHSREAMALDCTGEVMLAMGNAEDASAFHREAARMHRQLGDDWQEGTALAHLADCEAALGHDDASRENAARALALIERFTDHLAEQLKTHLREGLA